MAGNSYQIKIEIAVERWMYKYLTHELGESPWKITQKNYHGQIIFTKLQPKQKKLQVWRKDQSQVVYEMVIPWKYICKYGMANITQDNMEKLILYFQERFKRDLFLWVDSRIDLGGVERKKGGKTVFYVQESILSFCNKIGITEDDMPYDTMKKRVYRYLSCKQKPVIIGESV